MCRQHLISVSHSPVLLVGEGAFCHIGESLAAQVVIAGAQLLFLGLRIGHMLAHRLPYQLIQLSGSRGHGSVRIHVIIVDDASFLDDSVDAIAQSAALDACPALSTASDNTKRPFLFEVILRLSDLDKTGPEDSSLGLLFIEEKCFSSNDLMPDCHISRSVKIIDLTAAVDPSCLRSHCLLRDRRQNRRNGEHQQSKNKQQTSSYPFHDLQLLLP